MVPLDSYFKALSYYYDFIGMNKVLWKKLTVKVQIERSQVKPRLIKINPGVLSASIASSDVMLNGKEVYSTKQSAVNQKEKSTS